MAIIDDITTTGGRIISGSADSFNANQGIACIGDYASCPKCQSTKVPKYQSTGKIIEGTYNFIVAGKPAAYDGCIVACKCSPIGCNKIIAL
ncbi:PAAR domain-containing protein [Gilliamella apicola]|uniref:PAAR domain-containing protein n=1 Tax=Gilliamella apicola TaxID=1196095 RepID=A0A2V4DTZ6_9GAMM|nr:PAAR domain-containing protein [Gilliamella apicola]